jgi:hypothetical protein
MRSPLPPRADNVRRIGVAAILALSLGLLVIVVGEGFSTMGAVRVVEDVGLGVIVIALIAGVFALFAIRLGGWHDPESEIEFDELVRHSEELAREGLAVDPEERDFGTFSSSIRLMTGISRISSQMRSMTCLTSCATPCGTSPS